MQRKMALCAAALILQWNTLWALSVCAWAEIAPPAPMDCPGMAEQLYERIGRTAQDGWCCRFCPAYAPGEACAEARHTDAFGKTEWIHLHWQWQNGEWRLVYTEHRESENGF